MLQEKTSGYSCIYGGRKRPKGLKEDSYKSELTQAHYVRIRGKELVHVFILSSMLTIDLRRLSDLHDLVH